MLVTVREGGVGEGPVLSCYGETADIVRVRSVGASVDPLAVEHALQARYPTLVSRRWEERGRPIDPCGVQAPETGHSRVLSRCEHGVLPLVGR
jgi:hypothetical protein